MTPVERLLQSFQRVLQVKFSAVSVLPEPL